MAEFHSILSPSAKIHFVAKIFNDELTVVEREDGLFDIYNNRKLTQPGHDNAGVVRYLMYVYSNNPWNPEVIQMREDFHRDRQ